MELTRLANGSLFATDFRVERPLSEGGMGAVYVAEQLSTGARRALKLMHPQLVRDEKLRKRFEQEAKVGARIASDHVVQVVSAGIDEASATPWLAMELLQGEDLETYADRRGPLPLGEVTAIFAQLCHALSAAHAEGIVHRDLKPANIFLGRSRTSGVPFMVKVLDFGIAKVVAEAKVNRAATEAIGTPLWMAPEQTSRGTDITAAADVWALGLIAFRLLTGKPFWLDASNEGGSMMTLMKEVLIEAVPPASQRVRELESHVVVPSWFDRWFARCVERDLTKRFADATIAFAAWSEHAADGGALLTAAAPVDMATAETRVARVEATMAMAPERPVAPAAREATVAMTPPLAQTIAVAPPPPEAIEPATPPSPAAGAARSRPPVRAIAIGAVLAAGLIAG
ncbi:MAG: serine/threonine-protein kinase, partial [Polyangiales bacterium]